jgi:hypothetical protein
MSLEEFKGVLQSMATACSMDKGVTEADRKKYEWLLEKISKFATICCECVHCRSIDIEQNVDCYISSGKPKVYCRNFVGKEKPKVK